MSHRRSLASAVCAVTALLMLNGCAALEGGTAALTATGHTSTTPSTTGPTTGPSSSDRSGTSPSTTSRPLATASPSSTTPRPPWLGSRTVPTDSDGVGVAVDTPVELIDRRFATIDSLPPPSGDGFHATIQTLADAPEALARSTWAEGCPVPVEDLAYLTVSFHGFDGGNHTGEIIVHGSVADDIVSVFEKLHAARFPIEEMRIVTPDDLDAPPTGDGNNTAGFVCRPVTGGTAFSEHAKGLAVDINPFHNPYIRGDRVLPEQAVAYTNRSAPAPGMIEHDDVVVEAFAAIGWTWGGHWSSITDYQHFSATGR